MLHSLFNFLTRPSGRAREFANGSFFSVVLGTGALTGSAVSFYVGAALVWPFLWLFRQREWPVPGRPVLMVASVFAAYVGLEALWCLMLGGSAAFSEALENLLFVSIMPIWRVLKAPADRLLRDAAISASVVSVVAVLIVFYQAITGWAGYRAELTAGNPSVLAVLAGISLSLSLLGAIRREEDRRVAVLHACGAAASALLIIFAGTRVLWPALVILPLAAILITRPDGLRPGWKPVFAGALALGLFLSVAGGPVINRVMVTADTIRSLAGGDPGDRAISDRLKVWQTSLDIIRDHPLAGVGPGHFRTAMADYSDGLFGVAFGFSHAHNAILNAWIRCGIVGVIALIALFAVPLAVGLRAPDRDNPDRRPFLAFLVSLQAVYALSGLTGLAIGHDILDAVFVTGTVLALYGLYGPLKASRGLQ